jgi:hypothetical protein
MWMDHAVGLQKNLRFSGDGAKVIPIAIGKAKKGSFFRERGKTSFFEKNDS